MDTLFGKNREKMHKRFSISDIILFCIHSAALGNEERSFERLVKECFTLFPKTLSFARYPVMKN